MCLFTWLDLNSTVQYIVRYLTDRFSQLYEGHCRAYVVITSRAKTRRDFYNETIYKSNVVSIVCLQFAVSIDSDWNRDLIDVHHLNNFKIIKKLINSRLNLLKMKKTGQCKRLWFWIRPPRTSVATVHCAIPWGVSFLPFFVTL